MKRLATTYIVWLVLTGYVIYWLSFDEVDIYDWMSFEDMEISKAITEYKWKNQWAKDMLHQNEIKRIVVHHTATDPKTNTDILFEAINKNHAQRRHRWWVQKTWQQMMYHRLIWTRWRVYWNKDFNEIGRWSRNNNVWTIHIALQWNFNEQKPTDRQYTVLSSIIWTLRLRYWDIPVYWHWQLEWEATACPGRLFDYDRIQNKILSIQSDEKKVEKTQQDRIIQWNTVEFSLSRYYSVMKDQRRYYQNKTYDQDFKMNCSGDCLITASWKRLSDADKNNVVACPSHIPLWSKIQLDLRAWPHVVTCVDRGSAIVWNRLDMYCGVWDYALDNRETCITGFIKWRLL